MHQVNEIKKIMKEHHLDAMLLHSEQNRRWYTNFPSSLGYLFILKDKTYLFLDGRYITAARESDSLVNVDEILPFGKNLWITLNGLLKSNNIKRVGFEADWILYQEYETFKKVMPNQEWIGVDTSYVRMMKDLEEIANLQKACDIANQVYEAVLKEVKPGWTEKEVAIFVNKKFLDFGADKLSFDTIVASGVNGSKPHAVPTDKKIVPGELVTLDMGCYYHGYASDQTRTFQVGNQISKELLKIFQTVYDAQALGMNLVKPGVKAGDIHRAVADYIADHDFEGYFTHGLGHGYGLEIHEQPYVSQNGEVILTPGMTITIEPGIYIPGVGGVRIEDDLLVTEDGAKVLTSAIRELQKIGA